MSTVHEIIHDVFQLRFEGYGIDQIKVNVGMRGHLNSLVALNKIYETSMFQCSIASPASLFGKLIKNQLEKQYLSRRTCNKCCTIDEIHLSQDLVTLSNPLQNVRCILFPFGISHSQNWHTKAFTLPVKTVDFVVLLIVEASIWEVFVFCVQNNLLMLGKLTCAAAVNEMNMRQ